jgi:hypothetical protein
LYVLVPLPELTTLPFQVAIPPRNYQGFMWAEERRDPNLGLLQCSQVPGPWDTYPTTVYAVYITNKFWMPCFKLGKRCYKLGKIFHIKEKNVPNKESDSQN